MLKNHSFAVAVCVGLIFTLIFSVGAFAEGNTPSGDGLASRTLDQIGEAMQIYTSDEELDFELNDNSGYVICPADSYGYSYKIWTSPSAPGTYIITATTTWSDDWYPAPLHEQTTSYPFLVEEGYSGGRGCDFIRNYPENNYASFNIPIRQRDAKATGSITVGPGRDVYIAGSDCGLSDNFHAHFYVTWFTVVKEIGEGLGARPGDVIQADEVNITNGNMFISPQDLFIPGRGLPTQFTRTYNSQDDYEGPLGYGWTHSYNVNLEELADGTVVEMDEDGTRRRYKPTYLIFETVDDFEGDVSGWTTTGFWHLVEDNVSPYPNSHSPTHSFWYGQDATGNYDNGRRNYSSLTSPVIDLTDATEAELSFWYWYETESTGPWYDERHIQIRTGEDPWQTLTQLYDDSMRTWHEKKINLSRYVGQTVQIRFHFDTIDSIWNHFRGWYIDDFKVVGKARVPGVYTPPAGDYSSLTKNEDGTFRLVRKHGMRYDFSIKGTLTSITDRNDNQITLSYTNNLLTTVTDASGREVVLGYDGDGRIVSLTDPASRTVLYSYENGNLVSVKDQGENTTTYQYNEDHNLTVITDANGNHTYFEYDEEDRAIQVRNDGDNNKRIFDYDPENMTTTMTDSKGNQTVFTYNEDHVVAQVEDALGSITTHTWDEDINRTSTTDARDNTTLFEYDDRGNVTKITDPLENEIAFTYDSTYDLVTSITDPLNHSTYYRYDGQGNLIEVEDAEGNITENAYDEHGQLISLTDAENHQTLYEYDQHGNLVKITDPLENETMFTYDILGNSTGLTDAKENTTSYAYDQLNRLIEITYPDQASVSYAYDAVGNRTSVTDPKNNVTGYVYDVVNRLIQVTDALNQKTTYSYDTEGNRTAITDANSHSTAYEYDALNRLTKSISPLGNEASYNYDGVGNRISATDANDHTINYIFDASNRLTQITYPDNSKVEFTYDAVWRRTGMTDSLGQTTYSYDSLNRLIQVDGPGANDTISYEYDRVGNRTKMIDQDDGETNYTHDVLNRLVRLTDPQGKDTAYSYDSVSNLTAMIYPNNTQASYSFDNLNRLIHLANQETENDDGDEDDLEDIISSYTYEYDPAGMRTKVTLANGDSIRYGYDALNRLTSEIKKKWNDHRTYYSYFYSFDAVGNRTSLRRQLNQKPVFAGDEFEGGRRRVNPARWRRHGRGDDGDEECEDRKGRAEDDDDLDERIRPSFWDLPGLTNFSYSYDEENRLLQVGAVRQDTRYIADYEYDQNGNLISKTEYRWDEPEKAETTTYSYDFENRLTNITYPDGTTSEYTYDGAGKRVRAVENGRTKKFLYDGLNAIIERDENDRTVATYVRGLSYGGGIGGIVSVTRREEDENDDDEEFEIFYYHYNGIGTVTALTDDEGEVEQEYYYDAYGNLLSGQDGISDPYQFSTKEFSAKSDLIYFGARYYDPRMGRFITPDPWTWGPDDSRIFGPLVNLVGLTKRQTFFNQGAFPDEILDAFAVVRELRRQLILYVGSADPANYHHYIYCYGNPTNLIDPWGTGRWQKFLRWLKTFIGIATDTTLPVPVVGPAEVAAELPDLFSKMARNRRAWEGVFDEAEKAKLRMPNPYSETFGCSKFQWIQPLPSQKSPGGDK